MGVYFPLLPPGSATDLDTRIINFTYGKNSRSKVRIYGEHYAIFVTFIFVNWRLQKTGFSLEFRNERNFNPEIINTLKMLFDYSRNAGRLSFIHLLIIWGGGGLRNVGLTLLKNMYLKN